MKQHFLYRILLVWGIAFSLIACNEEDFVEATTQEFSTLELYTSSVSTRTNLLNDGTTVVWSAEDELAVYDYEATKHRFVADNVNGSSARFIGKITKKKEDFLALYPYELGAEELSVNNEIVVTLPQEQAAVEGSFAPNLNISVAKGARNVDGSPSIVTFYNVCQLLKFTVPDYAAGKIKQIQFATNTPVAGVLCVDYSADMPTTTITSDASKSIIVTPPAGSQTFSAGTYYIVSAPVTLNGFTMSFTCDNTTYTLGSGSTFGGQAGKVYSLGSIDLVNTPQVMGKHQYANGILQGTLLTIANPPLADREWRAVVKNSAGVVVRTVQGKGTLYSSEQDENWPYLLRGNYSLEYTFVSSNGREVTKTLPFNLNEQPELSVTVTALTSFSYYKGDGVARDITAANLCDPYKVYAPTIKINGVATKLLANPNYSFVVSNSFNGTLSKSSEGVYSYNDYTVSSYGAYSLTGNVTFDNTVRSGVKSVQITGLPYTAQPPTQSDWSGSATAWNGDHALLRNNTITKSFHCPEKIAVNVQQNVSVSKNSWEITDAKYSLKCGGKTLVEISPKSGKTENDTQTKSGELTTTSSSVSCIHEGGWYDSTNAKVYKISVQYRE